MNTTAIINSKNSLRVVMLIAAICTLGTVSLRSEASTPLTTVTITNNSQWEIRNLYLSPANNDNWGDDQLNGSFISPGVTRTLSVSWDQPTVKLVAEDQDGCFISNTVDATEGAAWTITASAIRNCGS